MAEHDLSLPRAEFSALLDNSRQFDTRLNNPAVNRWDVVRFREIDMQTNEFTGRSHRCRVTHVARDTDWLPNGFMLLALGPVDSQSVDLLRDLVASLILAERNTRESTSYTMRDRWLALTDNATRLIRRNETGAVRSVDFGA